MMVSIGPNFFYTVTLPCTLWFFDRGKAKTDRKKKVLFIDARHIFTQIDRAHREFTPGADRVHLQHRPALSRGEGRDRGRKQRPDEGELPEGQVRRCARALQGRHAR